MYMWTFRSLLVRVMEEERSKVELGRSPGRLPRWLSNKRGLAQGLLTLTAEFKYQRGSSGDMLKGENCHSIGSLRMNIQSLPRFSILYSDML